MTLGRFRYLGLLALVCSAPSSEAANCPGYNATLCTATADGSPGSGMVGILITDPDIGSGNTGFPPVNGCAQVNLGTAGTYGGAFGGTTEWLPTPRYSGISCSWGKDDGQVCLMCTGTITFPLITRDVQPPPRPNDPPDKDPEPNTSGDDPEPCNVKPPSEVPNPVNVMNGNMYLDQTDATIPGVGTGLVFTRSYNSANLAAGQHGAAFGPGWTHSYDKHLTPTFTGHLELRKGNGVPVYYQDANSDQTYVQFMPWSEETWIDKQLTPVVQYTRHFRRGGSEVYNSSGRIVAITDRNGNTTVLGYEAVSPNRLLTITEPSARTLTLAYTGSSLQPTTLSGPDGLISTYAYASGRLQSVTYPDSAADADANPDGGVTFAYDGAGRLTAVTDLTGRVLEAHAYDASGRAYTTQVGADPNGQERYTLAFDTTKTTVTDGLGHVTVYEFGGAWGENKITKVTGPCASCGDGESRSWTYDDKARVKTYTDAAGAVTTYTYDPITGDRLSEAKPLNHTTTYTYYADGRLNTRTAPNGQSTTWTYVAAGPQTVTETVDTGAPDRVTSFAYTSEGNIETITDPRGKVTSFAYYPTGDLETVTDPLGAGTPDPTDHTTTFEYDALGRRTAVIDPLSHRTETTYNSRGQAVRTRQFDGTRALDTIVTYDRGGRRTRVNDPIQSGGGVQKGAATEYDYDAYGRLWHVYQPVGENGARPTTTYAYDVMSNLTSLTDAESHTTAFAYDGYNRIESVTYPGARTESYTYDIAGRLLTKTDRKGVITTYGYDALSRLTSKTYSDPTPPFAYHYDETSSARGFLTSADQGGMHKLAWTYDLVGQALSEKYYANGTTLTSAVANAYDPGGNRTGLSLDGTTFTTYDFDDASRLSHIYRGATNFAFTYDDAHKRTGLTFPNGVGTTYAYDTLSRLTGITAIKTPTVVASAGYTYDDAGNRLSKTLPEYAETYLYDPLYRLKEVDRPSLTPTETYTYDRVGNRKTSIDASNWTYNERNELLSSGAATFTYDLNGNTLTKNDPTGNWGYEWNAENQLTRVLFAGSEWARFTYDPLGRRVEKIVNANPPTSYTYDGEDILRESRATTTARYVHGPGVDEPLAVEASSTLRYIHADALGSDIKHTDPNGAVSLTRTYDAFGQLQTGSTSLAGYAFTGRELDSEIGPLYYNRARYYDPKVGRFLSEDPVRRGDAANAYVYVENRPTSLVDRLGRQSSTGTLCADLAEKSYYACIANNGGDCEAKRDAQLLLCSTEVKSMTDLGKCITESMQYGVPSPRTILKCACSIPAWKERHPWVCRACGS